MATKRTGAAELASDVEKATENDGHAYTESFRRSDEVIHPSITVMTPDVSHRQQGAPSTDAQDNKGNVDSEEQDGIPEENGKNSKRYIRMTHAALQNQQNVHCVLLVLVAGAMSVSILQPPGSFDSDGHIRDEAVWYLVFASISFALAAAGLIACIVGSASLSDPVFYAPDTSDGMATANEILIIEDNISRMKRSRFYLLTSLAFFTFAFYVGAISVLGKAITRSSGYAVGAYGIYWIALFVFTYEVHKSGNRQALKRLG